MNGTPATPSTGMTTVTVRREIGASAEELFDAWLDVDSLAAIMHPGSKQSATVTTDPRVGGVFEVMMHQEANRIRIRVPIS